MALGRSFVKDVINRAVARYGYHLAETTHLSLGDSTSVDLLAQHLRQMFALIHVDAVIDVGANEGQYYDFIRERVQFTGPIVSFEPNPVLAATLTQRATSDPLWTIVDCALGSREDMLPLKVMTRTGWSSLLDKSRVSGTDRADTFEVDRVVSVPVRPLDAVLGTLSSFSTARPYLKIDAQGFDLEVLKGAPQTVARAVAVQTELELIQVYEGAPHYTSVLAHLQERHYAITGVFPVWRDQTLRIGEMDTVLRNMAMDGVRSDTAKPTAAAAYPATRS